MSEQECIRVFADREQIKKCKNSVKGAADAIGKLSVVFNLAGNEVRLSIMYLLYLEGKLCVCDLSDILHMQVPAISQHLGKMKDRRILEKKRVGAVVYYSLHPSSKSLLSSFFKLIMNESSPETKAA